MSKPREFWLNNKKIFDNAEDAAYMQNALLHKTIHVIEHRALTDLQEKIKELENKYHKLIVETLDIVIFNKNKQKELMDDSLELVDALATISCNAMMATGPAYGAIKIAEKALVKWNAKHPKQEGEHE